MSLSFLSLVPIFIAVFLFSLWRPKIAIFLPIVFHASFLLKTRLFFIPSTGLEMLIIGVLAGVWIGCRSPLIRGVRGVFVQTNYQTPFRSPLSGGKLRRIIFTEHFVIVFLVLLFVLSSTISAIIAPHPATAWGAWKALIIEPILYAVTLVLFVRRYDLWDRLILALLSGGMVSCLLSLVFWRFGADFWRFRGIYDVPNSLALILAPLLVVAALYYLTRFTEKPSFLQKACPRPDRGQESVVADPCLRRDDTMLYCSRDKRWLLIFTICVFSVLLIATQSIAGIVSVVGTLVLVMLLRKKFTRRVIVGVLAVVLLAIGMQIFSGKIPHLLNRTSSSLIAREQIWTVAASLIKDHPLIGTGLGTFEPAYQEKLRTLNKDFGSSGILEWVVRDPHNIFLSFWLNTGLLGLLSMVGLIVIGVTSFLRKACPRPDRGQESVGAGLCARPVREHAEVLPYAPIDYRALAGAAMLTLVIFGLFDVPYWKNDLALMWWVYVLGADFT